MDLKARKVKRQLSSIERFKLVGKLNSLPIAEFDQILIALGPPSGILPTGSASQGSRTFALFQWLEGPTGPGLSALIELLQQIPNLDIDEVIGVTTSRYRVVLDVDADTVEIGDLERVVNGLSVLLGDDSIRILDVNLGSLRIEITGDLEKLKRLKELFSKKQLTEISGISILEVERIGDHIAALQLGVQNWNQWKSEHPNVNVDLRGADFRSAVLNGINLCGASLVAADLRNTSLRGANLNGANLSQSSLDGADLSGADLTQSNLSGASLHDSILLGASLHQAVLRRSDLSFATLRGADLSRADFRDTTLRSANLRGANLDGASLSGADLSSTNLDNTSLRDVNLDRASLQDASLEGSNFSNTSLKTTDVRRSRFRRNQNLSTSEAISLQERGAIIEEAGISQEMLSELLRSTREVKQDTEKLERSNNFVLVLVIILLLLLFL